MKLKLIAAIAALAMPALAQAEENGLPPVPPPANSADQDEIDEDFSIVSIVAGLSGGPTSYLDGVKEMPWVLKLRDRCGLNEPHIRAAAARAFARTKLGFVSSDDAAGDFFERPLFQLIVTALPASAGCPASISARAIAPIEGARFVYDKKPLQQPSFVTIWESMHGEGGRVIYEPRADNGQDRGGHR